MQQRSERVIVRVTPRQLSAYHRAAAREGTTMSEWLRWHLDRHASEALGVRLRPTGPADD